jgi:hypothetical protein
LENVEEKFLSDGKQQWLILDDLMNELNGIQLDVEKFFTRLSHHGNISVFFLTQNLLYKSLRTITLNAHYIFLFKNSRDGSQIFLGRRYSLPDQTFWLMPMKTQRDIPIHSSGSI